MRWRWLTIGVIVAGGCQTLLTPTPKPASSSTVAAVPRLTPPESTAPQIAATEAPPRTKAPTPPTPTPTANAGPSPAPEDDALTLAAESLGRGDEPTAAVHLGAYVRQHPDQLMFRAQLAELLLRLEQTAEAKAEFEQFIAAAQSAAGPVRGHVVHCHTRLMEIAQRTDDPFAEAFHRGVGLVLVVSKLDATGATDDASSREEIVYLAITSLTEARERRPTDPRAALYLADAYDLAGNRRAADVTRAAARNLAAPGALTLTESMRLGLVVTKY